MVSHAENLPGHGPPSYYLALYRTQFENSLALGNATPFTIPQSLAGAFFLPVVYLSIPHRKRPWLFRLRFVVLLAMAMLNAHVLASGTSSTNIAVSYATGLAAAWGMIWGGALVGFMKVQDEVSRVALRKKGRRGVGAGKDAGGREQEEGRVDETVKRAEADGLEFYWQPYPEDGSWVERLGWVSSLFLAFRGVGWSFAISSVPHPPPPSDPRACSPVDFSGLPVITKSGYHRSLTTRSFLCHRLFHIAWSWLALDIWTLTARYDPYFVPGVASSTSHPLPPVLVRLPDPILSLVRSLAAVVGILSALAWYLNLLQIVSFFTSCYPLFTYPSISGSFAPILDRGLAGFWGSFWHQSFRAGFTAPTAYFARKQPIPPLLDACLTTFVAFLLSGLLHAAGGFTSLPVTTDISGPIAFFLLQFVGVVMQTATTAIVRRYMPGASKLWRRAGNAIYVAVWLHMTNYLLIGDMSRSAIWLYEPVPVSPLRAMGFGTPGEAAWRWDETYIPKWYVGRRWWESGIRI